MNKYNKSPWSVCGEYVHVGESMGVFMWSPWRSLSPEMIEWMNEFRLLQPHTYGIHTHRRYLHVDYNYILVYCHGCIACTCSWQTILTDIHTNKKKGSVIALFLKILTSANYTDLIKHDELEMCAYVCMCVSACICPLTSAVVQIVHGGLRCGFCRRWDPSPDPLP